MFYISTSSLSGYWLHKIFLLTKASWYDGVDLVIDFDNFDTIDFAYLQSLSTETGVTIRAITAPERKVTKRQIDAIYGLASELEVTVINLHPPHRLDREKDWFWEYLKMISEKYPRITANIVNAPPKTWLFIISEYGDARPETIKKITSHTALSIANVEPESGIDLMKTFTLLGNTIWHVYLSDKTEERGHAFPWEGNMPLESLLIRMKEAGYEGSFSLLVDPEELAAWDDKKVLTRLEEARIFLHKYFM
jgi:sugar phosphate isomerase/epimerase